MQYIATYHPARTRTVKERSYQRLNGTLRFLVRGMADGSLFPGEILDTRGCTVVSHDWLMNNWSPILDVLNQGKPPSAHPAVRDLLA